MEKKKCCANCLYVKWFDDNTYCCDRSPSVEIKPNPCGMYLFSVEQASKFLCSDFYVPFGNTGYSPMDFNMWLKANHPDVVKHYKEYVEAVAARQQANHKYVLRYEYPDAHGLIGDYEETFKDKDAAIAAAVEASKDKNNYNISIRHSWWDNQFAREDGEWVEWGKEIKK